MGPGSGFDLYNVLVELQKVKGDHWDSGSTTWPLQNSTVFGLQLTHL